MNLLRSIFYTGRHFATATPGKPILVTELVARAKRDEFDRKMARLRSPSPEQLEAMSV